MSTQTQPSQPKQFFFSSRRRHTRSLCDWSSDVCSSDLSRLIRMPDEWRQLDLHHVYSWAASVIVSRSEEHTSELQSHSELVCRLLLEKKKIWRTRAGSGRPRRCCMACMSPGSPRCSLPS